MSSLSSADKKKAQDEAQFLRVLRGPTIVKFYESFNNQSSLFMTKHKSVQKIRKD